MLDPQALQEQTGGRRETFGTPIGDRWRRFFTHIVSIMTDDPASHMMSAYGSKLASTPSAPPERYGGPAAWELIDLQTDAHEYKDVIDDPQYAETVKELRAELERLRTDLGAPEVGPQGLIER
jgi:N-sulphoglucosamine sulphohydrolase, C-terminal